MSEKEVTRKIKDWFKSKGGICHKVFGSSMNSGFPDLVGCIDGRAWVVEVKSEKARPRVAKSIRETLDSDMKALTENGATILQAKTLIEWRQAGAIAILAKSVEDVEKEYDKVYT